jgi:hypothetical protein
MIGFERCEEFRVSAGASGVQEQVREQFPGWMSHILLPLSPVRRKFCAGSGRQIAFVELLLLLHTPATV